LVAWSIWVFAYSTRWFSFESWLLLLMNGGLLKQIFDALISISCTIGSTVGLIASIF
jgi:energy-converting hydrogenase Eha subunit G